MAALVKDGENVVDEPFDVKGAGDLAGRSGEGGNVDRGQHEVDHVRRGELWAVARVKEALGLAQPGLYQLPEVRVALTSRYRD